MSYNRLLKYGIDDQNREADDYPLLISESICCALLS